MEKDEFQNGFLINGQLFQPLAWISRADLPDFGCEGRPDGGPVFGAVWGERADGAHFWRVAERDILAAGLRDDVWIGLRNGEIVLASADRSAAEPTDAQAVWAILETDGVKP